MKKLLIPLLLLLLLAGCGGQDTAETTQSETRSTEATEPPGLYVPNSDLEQSTQGTVKLYTPRWDPEALSAVGEQLLLIYDKDIRMLSGDKAVETAALAVDSACFQPIHSGAVYYDAETKQAVYLDSQLRETERVQLPEQIQGVPVFSANGGEIFYCAGQDIRAMDVEQGISRLIKTHSATVQALLGSYFDGAMLGCKLVDESGKEQTVYLSTQTGQTLSNDDNIFALDTAQDTFFAQRRDGTVTQRIFGTYEGQITQLNIPQSYAYAALDLGGVVGCSVNVEGALELSFYELESGKRTAAVTLPGIGEPIDIYADRWSNALWVLAVLDQRKVLLRWDIGSAAVTDDKIYTSAVYTSAAPNEAGLKQCEERADDMEDAYGVTIRIWKDAVKYTGGYSMIPEHQTQAIQEGLDRLEAALKEFPEKFLYKSVSTRIRICIMRSVSGEAAIRQYWYDGDAFIAVSVGCESFREDFIRAVGYVVDSHVLGNSPKYDYWDALNPQGFAYGDETTYSVDYLAEGKACFVSMDAMQSATQERSELFLQAMLADNGQLFQSETMQKKLLVMCQAIRDAWNYERKSEVYPWEQYLSASIAYQE